jgi:type IV pilus assembly protein PilM
MAKSDAVWGIDIGQCALKAMRCRLDDDGVTVIADAFDYIEYPKVLSQPEANPEELIKDALTQFLSNNDVKRDKVAMSVSGQSGLSRFFKPPPVDAKMIPDIVKYEARQQIPFALEDVIWDYQQLGGTEVDGFALETEVGLFAMKREQVFRAIKPFMEAEVELYIVQLSPLCVFNFIVHDVLNGGPAPEDIDPENPPPSLVILSVGTETTDLVITNGIRLWQRNIPLGGNHFTKQLSKELKLTYAKAEHLKRNAKQSEDPKTVFQVMRPIFNDMVNEIQRSLGFFRNIDKQAKIGQVVMLGNAIKLPGLRQYLEKNLGFEFLKLDSFTKLNGSSVISAPSFKENVLSYGVCYGLCLQGLGVGKLKTNLLPREFLVERMIRDKKPWSVATVGALMLAFAFNFFFYYSAWYQVNPVRSEDGNNWEQVAQKLESVNQVSNTLIAKDTEQMGQWAHVKALGDELANNYDRKLLWLEVLKAINESLPRDEAHAPGYVPEPNEVPFSQRPELHIEYIESMYFPDMKQWFTDTVRNRYLSGESSDPMAPADPAANAPNAPDAVQPADGTATAAAGTQAIGPEGPGWVIEIGGYHYHNEGTTNTGGNYVRSTLIKHLKSGKVKLSIEPGPGGQTDLFEMKELGIGYPILVHDPPPDDSYQIPNPNYVAPASEPGQGPVARPTQPAADDKNNPPFYRAPRHSFVVQFSWQPKSLSKRFEDRKKLQPALPPSQDSVAVNQQGGT